MSKKILLIIGILVIVGIALFFVLSSKPQTGGEGTPGFSLRDYLPFGNSGGTEPSPEPSPSTNPTPEPSPSSETQSVPRLRKLSSEPVAGAIVFNNEKVSVVRFVEKGTGNVYEARSDTDKIERLTNTTIPKIIRAFWLPNGSGFLAQTLLPESEIIETSFVKLNKNAATSSNEILTPFSTTVSKLPTNIRELSIRPDGGKIFYYTINNSLSNWFISNPDGTLSTALLSHPLTEWLPEWVSANLIMLQTKSSSGIQGYTYSYDVGAKSLKKVGLGISGLSSNPNQDGSFILGSNGGALPQLFLIDNKSTSLTEVTANTLADKCVWQKKETLSVYCAVPNQIPSGIYPDNWYQGLVQTEDSLRKIDLKNDVYYNTSDLSEESDQKIDVTDLSLSPDETHLIFRNKVDGFLWMLRIEE